MVCVFSGPARGLPEALGLDQQELGVPLMPDQRLQFRLGGEAKGRVEDLPGQIGL